MKSHTSRRQLLRTGGAIASTAGLAGIAGCTGVLGEDGVAISSKRFTEQRVLGQIAIEALEANTDLDIVDETGLGGTVPNFEALREREVDLYWEYTGTAWITLPPERDEVIADSDELHDQVAQEFESEHDISILDYAPLDNAYVITASPDWHADTGVDTLGELAEYANDGNAEDIDPVLGPEFQEREDDGWPGLLDHYEFDDDAAATLDDNVRTVDEDIVYQALDEDEGDIGMGFNTDPRILMFDLHVFEDDEGFFPAYNASPMVHNETLDEHPEIADVLNEITPQLTDETIREMNDEVANEERDAANVASEFLEDEGLV